MEKYLIVGLSIAVVMLAIILMKTIFVDLKREYARNELLETTLMKCNNKLKYFQKRADSQSDTILVMLKRNVLLSNTVKKQTEEIESVNKLLGK